MFRCSVCAREYPAYKLTCPGCRHSNTFFHYERATAPVMTLDDVEPESSGHMPCFVAAFDDLFDGGIPRGCCAVVAGPPGAGKSTLLLQAAAQSSLHRKTYYFSLEENLPRLKSRALRLALDISNLNVSTLDSVRDIARVLRFDSVSLAVIDSLPHVRDAEIKSRAGSPTQLVQCARKLSALASSYHCALIVVGHVTKTNQLSGPRSVEHEVDAMIHFRPHPKKSDLRILEASKNRHGPAFVPQTLAMTAGGLVDV